MRCISKVGLSSVTMAQVTKEAGLSRGIANLHFERKENLLIETLRFVTDEYNRGQADILNAANFSSASEQLAALVQFQFSRSVTEATKMAVWFAFYGEATSRPNLSKNLRRLGCSCGALGSGAVYAIGCDAAGSGKCWRGYRWLHCAH